MKLTSVMVLIASLLTTGCIFESYGNYSNANMFASASMADNTVVNLATLYHPGRTTFTMKQPAKIARFSTCSAFAFTRLCCHRVHERRQTSNTSGTPLGYVVNTIVSRSQVKTLMKRRQVNRGFVLATDGKAYPAGPWTHL